MELLEPAPHLLHRHVGHRLQQVHRHLVADHRGGLEQTLVLVAEPVDAGGDGGAHGGRHLQRQGGTGEPVRAGWALERAGLEQAGHALLEEERVTVRARRHEPLERAERGAGAEQCVQQLIGGPRLERVHPHRGEARVPGPAVRVLRAIGARHQHVGRQGLDQRVHGGVRLGVHPLHVLEDHHEGLAPALTRHQAVNRAHDVAPAVAGIHGTEAAAVLRHPQHPQDGRHALLEVGIEIAQPGGHLVADGRGVVAALHLEVAAMQLDPRPVAGGPPVGDGGRLDHETAPRPAPPRELEGAPRTPRPGASGSAPRR